MKRKPNQNKARRTELQDQAHTSGLAKREVLPPEEFAAIGEFGEYPEFRPGDRESETQYVSSSPDVVVRRRELA